MEDEVGELESRTTFLDSRLMEFAGVHKRWRKRLQRKLLRSLLAQVGPSFTVMLLRSLRIEKRGDYLPHINRQGCIYTGWHETILLCMHAWAKCDGWGLASPSEDADMGVRVGEKLGWRVFRASSSKMPITGLSEILDLLNEQRDAHFFTAADGPRGPRRQFKRGPIYMAAKSRRPLVVVANAHERPWRLRSWDRFAVPRPFSRACIIGSEPFEIPFDVNRKGIDRYQRLMQAELDRLQAEAELRVGRARGKTSVVLDAEGLTQRGPGAKNGREDEVSRRAA
tara:strand:+ start:362 stop:1207 length:846 start_codon:yes stop_codon:yes gene_type:complete